jgi:hypothetical protein
MKFTHACRWLSLLLPIAASVTQARAAVSNLGYAVSGGHTVDFTTSGSNTFSTDFSNSFTTGSSATMLHDFTLSLGGSEIGSGFTAALYTNNSGVPGSLLLTLSGNSAPSGVGLFTYTGTYTLSPTTTYWAVFTVPHAGPDTRFQVDTVGTPNQTGDAGWSIGDAGYERYGFNGVLGAWSASYNPAQFAVNTSAVPEPSSLVLAAVGLIFTGCRRRK